MLERKLRNFETFDRTGCKKFERSTCHSEGQSNPRIEPEGHGRGFQHGRGQGRGLPAEVLVLLVLLDQKAGVRVQEGLGGLLETIERGRDTVREKAETR